jgi:hypothetical protein
VPVQGQEREGLVWHLGTSFYTRASFWLSDSPPPKAEESLCNVEGKNYFHSVPHKPEDISIWKKPKEAWRTSSETLSIKATVGTWLSAR